MSRDYGAQFDFLDTEPVGRALDCLGPRQTAAGPFHYLINEQAKSLLALQELQHEVGALLEFRDLVIETFPSLRTKLGASASSPHQPAGGMVHSPHRTSDWTPGVRVRRKLGGGGGGTKKSDAVPDSGFSTETSSKDTHSASSTAMAATSAGTADEAEDELWSLLDLIHRKGTRLKEEVESLQDQLQQRNPPEEELRDAVFRSSQDDVEEVRKERDLLMGRVADMEAEIVASRIHTSRLQEDMEQLLATKQDLEEQLRAVLDERGEVNSRIHDLHAQFVSSKDSGRAREQRTPSAPANDADNGRRTSSCDSSSDLCALDRVLGADVPKVKVTDSRKFEAILAERNPTVLQKHLLSSTVQNEILMKQLENATKLEVDLVDKLGKVREENEELKFQLEDKSIELEGTRAQMRMLEQMQKGTAHDGPDVIPSTTMTSSTPTRGEILSSSMRNMSPIPMTLQIDNNSSTESGHDQTGNKKSTDSGRRKPSKIPLKSYTAPKPPGRGKPSHSTTTTSTTPSRSRSGDSLSRPHSAQSSRDSLPKPSTPSSSLPKSRNCSLVTSKDSLSSKLRGSDSLSRLSGASFGSRGATMRKSSTPNVKWTSGTGKEHAQSQAADKVDSNREKSPYRWNRSSSEEGKIDYLDSLDPNSSSNKSTTDSSSQKFQTANTFTWNKPKEYYDSIDSNFSSSLYQQNGEELAECDSLEKHIARYAE